MKNVIQKHMLSGIIILIFTAVIANYLIFTFTDNRTIFVLDADYGHKIQQTHKMFVKIIKADIPLKTILHLPETILAEKYAALAFLLLPKSLETFRLLHLIPLLFILLAVLLLAKKLKNPYAALTALLFTVSSPGIISFSKQIWPHFYLALFLLWGILFIAKSNFGSKANYLLTATIFLLLAQNTHYAAIFYTSMILSTLVITSNEKKLSLLLFWLTLNLLNISLPFTTAKILIIAATALTYRYLRNYNHAKNICLSLGIFALLTTASLTEIFSYSATNESNTLLFNQSFYFISFSKTIGLLFFISAVIYLFTSYLKNPLKITISSVFLPEALMFFAQVTGMHPAPRGLDTYVTLFLLSFVLSASFFASLNKKFTSVIIFAGIALFITHAYYLPHTEITPAAKATLPLFEKNKKNYGREDLKNFLNTLDKNTTVGVLTPYTSEAIYPKEISFLDETAVWLLAKKNTNIVPVFDPTQSFGNQVMLLKNDYFIFEKNKDPHRTIIQTEEILNQIPLFYLYRTIKCTDKEILIYRKENFSTAATNQAIKFVFRKFLSSPS